MFWTHKFAVGLIDMGNSESRTHKPKIVNESLMYCMSIGDELLGAGNLFEDTPAVPDVSMPAPPDLPQAKSLGNISIL